MIGGAVPARRPELSRFKISKWLAWFVKQFFGASRLLRTVPATLAINKKRDRIPRSATCPQRSKHFEEHKFLKPPRNDYNRSQMPRQRKNVHAAELARHRWSDVPKSERAKHVPRSGGGPENIRSVLGMYPTDSRLQQDAVLAASADPGISKSSLSERLKWRRTC